MLRLSIFFLSLCFSHVTKTETADDDMDFVVGSKLSRSGTPGHYHYNPSGRPSPRDEYGRPLLPLFSSISRRSVLLSKVMRYFRADMELFGYRVLRTPQDQLVADCSVRSPAVGLCC